MSAPPERPVPESPLRVGAARAALPLHDVVQSRAIESQALAGTAPHELMARAGLAAARLALAVAPHARRVTVLAGPGNNGGDGLLAALHLHRVGRTVRVVHLAEPGRLPDDATDALEQLRRAGLPTESSLDGIADADLLIDALLGLGATRAPQGDILRAIEAANASGRPALAIDLPSGLNPDTGAPYGPVALCARWTLCLLTLKPGLFTALGRDHSGEVWHDDLGVEPGASPQAWLGSAAVPPLPGFGARRHAQHKGSFGDLTVVGGAAGMQGAAWLAARAGLAAGAGRVYVDLLSPQAAPADAIEVMSRPAGWMTAVDLLRQGTAVCGCGGGAAVSAALVPLLADAGRLLLDADALNAVAASAALQSLLQDRAARGLPTVLTPHPLEAARLLGTTAGAIQSDRLGAATHLSERFGAVVVLKGSGSVIAAPGCAPWVNPTGNAALATPGSGDVLAGWIGGLWAGLPDPTASAGAAAARCGAWLHGRAADLAVQARPGRHQLPLRASRLIDAMAAAVP